MKNGLKATANFAVDMTLLTHQQFKDIGFNDEQAREATRISVKNNIADYIDQCHEQQSASEFTGSLKKLGLNHEGRKPLQ